MSYAELHTKTNFSFLEGASHPDELVRRAAELGYGALAVTDRSSLAGVVRAHGAAKEVGLKLVIGAEIAPADAPPVVLWATDRAAYGRLASLITRGRRRAEKGECRLALEDVAEYAEGLIAGVVAKSGVGSGEWGVGCGESGVGSRESGGRDCGLRIVPHAPSLTNSHPSSLIPHPSSPIPHPSSPIPQPSSPNPQPSSLNPQPLFLNPQPLSLSPQPLSLTAAPLSAYREVFGDRCYLLAELHRGPDDRGELERLVELARRSGVPLVAAGDVHYHVAERKTLHDVLVAIRHNTTVSEARGHLFANAERHLKTPEEMAAAFARAPDAIRRTVEIADRCTFSLDELRYEYPEELAPRGEKPIAYLTRLTWAGARKRYPQGIPEKVRRLLEHELRLIEELRYEAYFLTVWDLVRFARRRGILCQGRGSAANSAVCYSLGITAVDPERIDLLFERFVSRERNEAPDIDVDFEHERREEVLQYLYEKYGRDRAGMTAEVITYRPRSAVRDVGKALGLSLDRVDRLAKRIEHSHGESGKGDRHLLCEAPFGPFRQKVPVPFSTDLAERCREAGIDPATRVGRQLVELVGRLVGFPRHLSQHTGGMVMTQGRLCELVPIENAAMDGRTVIQWNKDDLDELGILKVDCLALGMLTAVRKCFEMVRKHYGRELTLSNVPEGDEDVYAMIRRADTMGVFQIESRAQMSMLPRLRPRCFYDLVIEVAIVRPGPIQGNMVHPYLRRRNGEEPVTYPNEAIREVLQKTLGVPLFQEQAMRLAVVAAGFTPGEADELRRAMGAWRRPGLIDKFRRKLVEGMRSTGLSPEYAEAVFRQIRGFGEYGFPESHAASFALLVYVSAWLKHHYQAAFTAALLNSQPMGFYAPAQLVRNAREHGVEVRPVDVNSSDWESTLEPPEGSGFGVQGSGLRGQGPEESGVGSGESGVGNGEWRVASGGAGGGSSIHPSSFSLHPSLRLGFHMLQGTSEAHGRRIEEARGEGPFQSLDDFTRRTGLGRSVATRLAKAGAFGSLGLNRREALWHAMGQDQKALPLFDGLDFGGGLDSRRVRETHQTEHERAEDERGSRADRDTEEGMNEEMVRSTHPTVDLPKMSAAEEVLADYRAQGLSLGAHPMQFLRRGLGQWGVSPASGLASVPNGGPVRVAGIVLVRQRPGTAKGITFVTLEDETGVANLIIRPDVWKRWRSAALGATILLAHGRLQRQGGVIHVLCTKLENLSNRMKELGSRSRDFC
ncbi:MAG TPA: error-prone DNA polymerase [Thermoguttaceae bacterium]|nr:error-prone DNA polymerase [Thermoguttaceae bacterium]